MYTSAPKICSCPIRTIVIVMCTFALMSNGCGLFFDGHEVKVAAVISSIMEIITLYGAVKSQPRALKIALLLSVFSAMLLVAGMLVVPVYVTSQLASGYTGNRDNTTMTVTMTMTMEVEQEIEQEIGLYDADGERFWAGMSIGYMTELAFAIALFLCLSKYVLIDRLYMFAKSVQRGEVKGPQVAA